MSPLPLEIVLQTPIGHEWEDDERYSIRCVKTHSSQTKNVGVLEIFHYIALIKECLQFVSGTETCKRKQKKNLEIGIH